MCHCTVCKREFEYGDKWSPMFNNVIWKHLLEYYGLVDYEKAAEIKFNHFYDKYEETGNKIYRDKAGADDCHTYICYECAEKALGRKIVPEDLIAEDVPLNVNFERAYFGKEPKSTTPIFFSNKT